MSRDVLVIETGTANTASVLAGLRRADANPVLGADPDLVRRAERVVLPGVGALAAAADRLRAAGLDEALRERVAAGRPTLAICLGLQLLCADSEESPGATGLGIIRRTVRRFPDTVTVPQMGWNNIRPDLGCRYLQPGWAYFANSYRLTDVPVFWHAAWAEHAGRFVAACEQGDVVACQFHPELSGAWGADLLGRWVSGRPSASESGRKAAC